MAAAPSLRLLQVVGLLALRGVPLANSAAGRAALRALRKGGGVRGRQLWLPAAHEGSLASSLGGFVRGAAGEGNSPLQVRGVARPGAGAGRADHGQSRRPRTARGRPGCRAPSSAEAAGPRLQPVRAARGQAPPPLGIGAPPGRLLRLRDTPSQTGLDRLRRRDNVDGAFGWRGPNLEGLPVVVVDDVTTTGATLEACAVTLRAAGAGRILGLTVARVLL